MRVLRGLGTLLLVPLLGCASGGTAGKPAAGKVPPVDLRPAQAALEEARHAGAPRRAAEPYRQAEAHLKEAEALGAGGGLTAEKAQRAEFLGRLATAEARCATNLARLYPTGGARTDDADVAARLRRAEEDRRRLEERAALLQRDLELTETEVVRTKARLQGVETKADASSVIAEARILMGRLAPDDRATSSRCQELLAKAEQQINEGNYGAAVFFARKAQEITRTIHEAGRGRPRE